MTELVGFWTLCNVRTMVRVLKPSNYVYSVYLYIAT
jgi:hypothetical protein